MYIDKLTTCLKHAVLNATALAVRIEMRFRISLVRHTCHDGVFIVRKYPELNDALNRLIYQIDHEDPTTPTYQLVTKPRRAYLRSLYRDYGSPFNYTLQWLLVHVDISDTYPAEVLLDSQSEYARGGKRSRVTTRL